MKQIYLSYEERYRFGYLQGYRIGRIKSTRKILIKCLNKWGKKQGCFPCKKVIQKINREIDLDFLGGLILSIVHEKLLVKELGNCYDMLFLLPNKDKNKKSFWRWPFNNENALLLDELLGDD